MPKTCENQFHGIFYKNICAYYYLLVVKSQDSSNSNAYWLHIKDNHIDLEEHSQLLVDTFPQ